MPDFEYPRDTNHQAPDESAERRRPPEGARSDGGYDLNASPALALGKQVAPQPPLDDKVGRSDTAIQASALVPDREKTAVNTSDPDGLSDDEIRLIFKAADEFVARRDRVRHPPGEFDKAKRFYAAERTQATENCRRPSREWPYPQLLAARSAKHVAEVFSVNALYVKRAAKMIDEEFSDFALLDDAQKAYVKHFIVTGRRLRKKK